MFCTSLRRRPSFAPIISRLIGSPSLALRESRCDTHDITLPFTGTPSRQHRILLLSPSCVAEANAEVTIQRIQHFAALTGGQDLTIVFLLNPPRDTRFISAKVELAQSMSSTSTSDQQQHGTLSFAKLQALLFDHAEIPYLPILPLAKIDDLPDLLRSLSRRGSSRQIGSAGSRGKEIRALDLLAQCTVNPPMSQQMAFFLSDLFEDLAELGKACLKVKVGKESSSDILSDGVAEEEDERLLSLKELVGEADYANVVEFWREEWLLG